MIVHPDFFDNWKVKQFTDLMRVKEAQLLVQRLWAHCQLQGRSSFTFDAARIKAICHWDGDAELLFGALKTCGFIVQNPTNLRVS